MEYGPSEAPHGTIETNRTCDLGCRLCYNLDRASIKPTAQVKAEVDLLLRKRNVQAVSLLGGEPTLHPGLSEIIAHVKRRGRLCQLLTNGRRLAAADGGEYLEGLVRAGLDRVAVHMDSGQALGPEDLDAARHQLFSRLEAQKVHFCLSITIYNEDRASLAGLARRYSGYRYFDGILAILAREPGPRQSQNVRLEEEFEGLRRGLGITPSAYVPSNRSRDEVNWLLYLYFLDAEGDSPMPISPALNTALRRFHRLVKGRELFLILLPPSLARPALALTAASESLLRPRRARGMLGQIFRSLWRGARFHFIAIQAPPEIDEKTGEIRICRACPDATIRNGRLVPVCLADRMSPLPGYAPPGGGSDAWRETVLRHLEA
jgi:hypothetical protein